MSTCICTENVIITMPLRIADLGLFAFWCLHYPREQFSSFRLYAAPLAFGLQSSQAVRTWIWTLPSPPAPMPPTSPGAAPVCRVSSIFSNPLAAASSCPSDEIAPVESGLGKRGYCRMRFLARGSQMDKTASPPSEANVACLIETSDERDQVVNSSVSSANSKVSHRCRRAA